MGFFAQRVNAGGVDPPIIEVEERANRNSVIDRGVRPASFVQRGDIRRPDVNRIAIYLIDEAQQRFFGFGQPRRFEVFDDPQNQGFVPKQFRRNCGVGFQSKRTIVSRGSVSCDEFT